MPRNLAPRAGKGKVGQGPMALQGDEKTMTPSVQSCTVLARNLRISICLHSG
jgi:hypothetical protein